MIGCLGALVFGTTLVVVAPGVSALVLATAVFLHRIHRQSVAEGSDTSLIQRLRRAPSESQLGVALPVIAASWLGLDLLLGAAGNRLVLIDLLAGLPLLLPTSTRVTLHDLLADASAAEPEPTPAVPETRSELRHAGIGDLDLLAAVAKTGVSVATSSLSNDELCHAWRASHRALLMSHDAEVQSRIAAARGRYLDELQRRDPDGFERWLASGEAGSSDPGRYLTDPAVGGPEHGAGSPL